MASAYTPGLLVTEQTKIVKVRELPLPGKSLVSLGDKVKPETTVLSAELPGDIDIIRLAERLGFDPQTVIENLKVEEGQSIEAGQVLCSIKTFFGLFTSEQKATRGGLLEFITESNAHVGIRQPSTPLEVDAYISGTVSEVNSGKSVTIETDGALIQGIFGVGGESKGTVYTLPIEPSTLVSEETIENLTDNINGCVIVGGQEFNIGGLRAAASKGASCVVTGSISAETLRQYVGYDIGVTITGDEEVPSTLIITEGFGKLPISERVIRLSKKLDGKSAAVNGATQVRAGAMRPEIIISNSEASGQERVIDNTLQLGSKVRMIRVPYFGALGEVTELPNKPEKIETGAKVRVLRAKLGSGETVTVPRANVELVQG